MHLIDDHMTDLIIAVLGSGLVVQLGNVAVRRLSKVNMWKAAMDRINEMHADILDYEEDTRKLSIELNDEKQKNLICNQKLEAALKKQDR